MNRTGVCRAMEEVVVRPFLCLIKALFNIRYIRCIEKNQICGTCFENDIVMSIFLFSGGIRYKSNKVIVFYILIRSTSF